jgi:hypothetical protein
VDKESLMFKDTCKANILNYGVCIWWSVALQPRPGLGLPYGFHDSL